MDKKKINEKIDDIVGQFIMNYFSNLNFFPSAEKRKELYNVYIRTRDSDRMWEVMRSWFNTDVFGIYMYKSIIAGMADKLGKMLEGLE